MALTKPQGNMVMKLAAEQASTSGTAIDFTGIPAGTQMIIVQLVGVSTNGASLILVQIGDSGGIETTGYDSGVGMINTATASSTTSTAGFLWDQRTNAAATRRGTMVLFLEDSSDNTWTAIANSNSGDIVAISYAAGAKALSATLDRVRITSANPDTFDAGSISISYF